MNGKVRNGLLALVFGLMHTAHAQNEGTQTLNQKGFFGKALAAMATSNMAYRWNQLLERKLPGVPAREDIAQLGQEAQSTIGIPADKQVPIRYGAGLRYAAQAHANAIVVSDQFYDEAMCAYGVKRCDMSHESVHIKYNDDTFRAIPYLSSIFAAIGGTKKIINPKGRLKLLYIPSLVAGHFIGGAIRGQYQNYFERRADIEGHYATQCHHCVTEKAEDIRDTRDFMHETIRWIEAKSEPTEGEVRGLKMAKQWLESKKPYLSVEENEIIAADLQRDNKVCAFHKNGASS
jgi:hypothetical protein